MRATACRREPAGGEPPGNAKGAAGNSAFAECVHACIADEYFRFAGAKTTTLFAGIRYRDDESRRQPRLHPQEGGQQRSGPLCASLGAGAGAQRRQDPAGRQDRRGGWRALVADDPRGSGPAAATVRADGEAAAVSRSGADPGLGDVAHRARSSPPSTTHELEVLWSNRLLNFC